MERSAAEEILKVKATEFADKFVLKYKRKKEPKVSTRFLT